MQFDAFFELCRMYLAWTEASRAELVAEPWRGAYFKGQGDQLQMGLTPVWLDHNPPDGGLSKLDYNRVPVLPAFANHEVSPPPAWP
eukprot:jgi/Tetstr1/460339/TSEL_005639.t1